MKKTLLFGWMFFCLASLHAQLYVADSFLNSNNVPNIGPEFSTLDMAFDHNHNLWVLTQKGINRYDDSEWHSYPQMLDFTPWYIHTDLFGNIWVGTCLHFGHFAIFNGTNWEWDLQRFVVGFANATDSSVWIGGRMDLRKYKNGVYINCSDSTGYLEGVDHYTMAVDSTGIVWMGGEYGLLSFNGHVFTVYGNGEGMPLGLVEWIEFDNQDRMWALSGNQVGVWDGNNWELFSQQDGLLPGRDKICNDGTGRMWVLSFDTPGLNLMQGDSLIEYTLPVMNDEIITDVKCDQQNNLWFSIYLRGVLKVSPNGNYVLYQGNTINDSRHIAIDKDETLWISNFGGISSLDKSGNWTFRNESTGFFTNKFDGLCKDDSLLYFSYYSGLVSYNGHDWTHDTTFPAKLPIGLYLDHDKRLWTGSKENGAYYRDSTGWHHLENSGTYPYVQSFMQDHSGNMWIGSFNWDTKRSRISYYDGQVFTHYELDQYSSFTREFLEDKNQNLWAATGWDLHKFIDGEWKVYEVFVNDTIFLGGANSLYEDSRGWLWAGSTYGAFCCKNGQWHSYEFPAPPNMAIIVMDITEDKNGHMYFGTQYYGVYRMEIIDNLAIIETFKIQAGPNPATNYINVYLPEPGKMATMQVMNTNGQCLLSEKCSENVCHLNVSGFLPGVYILKIEQGGREYVHKFVKQ